LQSVYSEAGHPDEATSYDELATRYEERATALAAVVAGEAPAAEATSFEPAPVEVEAEEAPAAPWPTSGESAGQAEFADQPVAEFEVSAPPVSQEEIDISAEWEGAAAGPGASVKEVEATPAAEVSPDGAAVAEIVEEVRFYLAHSMAEQARAAFAKLQGLVKDSPAIAALEAEVEAAAAETAPAPPAVEEIEIAPEPEPVPSARDEVADLLETAAPESMPAAFTFHQPKRTSKRKPEPESQPVAEVGVAHQEKEKEGVLGDLVADLEDALGDGFLPAEDEPKAPVEAVAKAAPAAPAEAVLAETELHMTASASAGIAPTAAPAFTYQPTQIRPLATAGAQAPAPAAGVDLAEMFGDLKQELEEDAASSDEDPETHYNLGVAFREMGLLDEAIGELQKVCQSVDRGHPFGQVMQTYTWLAQCFLDKGVPEAAIRWYERALKIPTIDEDTRVALHYELASAYETAHDKGAALNHFLEVYGSNIDYRDVTERIKALRA